MVPFFWKKRLEQLSEKKLKKAARSRKKWKKTEKKPKKSCRVQKKWLFLCFHEYLSPFHEKSAFFRHFHEKSDIFRHFLQKVTFFVFSWVIGSFVRKKDIFLGPDRNLPESIAGFWKVYQKVLRDSEKFTRKRIFLSSVLFNTVLYK